jgi:hypothetical protein
LKMIKRGYDITLLQKAITSFSIKYFNET